MRKSALSKDMAWAIIIYMERAAGAWPYGTWQPDGFYPDRWEYKSCCADIDPTSMYQHCCSVKHVAALFNQDPTQLDQYFSEVKGEVLWARAMAILTSGSTSLPSCVHQSSAQVPLDTCACFSD